jgi:hypothetical protein
VLDEAEGRSKREVERLVRTIDPQPDVKPSIRKLAPPLPTPEHGVAADRAPTRGDPVSPRATVATQPLATPIVVGTHPAALFAEEQPTAPACRAPTVTPSAAWPSAPRPAVIRPLAPARYSLHVTLSEETHAKLRRAQDLLAHAVPNGDPAVVLDRALTLLVADLERKRFAARGPRAIASATSAAPRARHRPLAASTSPSDALGPEGPPTTTSAPRARSRHIPAAVRRAVWLRDEGRCTAVEPSGRCPQTRRLEFHHRVPVADGGETTVASIILLCADHHARESRRWFGEGERACGRPTVVDSDRTESDRRASP